MKLLQTELEREVPKVLTSPPAPKSSKRWYQRRRLYVALVLIVLLSWAIRQGQERAKVEEALRESFEQYLLEGQFEKAEEILANFDSNAPWTKDARLRLTVARERVETIQEAKNLIAQGEYDKAVSLLLDLFPSKETAELLREARYGAAQAAITQERWRDALGYLRDLPLDYRDTAQLKATVADTVTRLAYEEGLQAFEEGDYARAERLFEEAKSAGGETPADLDERLATATELRVKAEREAEIAAIREEQRYYTYGDVGLAVGNAVFRSRIDSYYAQQDHVFVAVYASVRNQELVREHANPHHFRLATPDGLTVPHHLATYSFDNFFDAVDLNQGQHTAGWIVFYVPMADTYTLHYDSFFASASKKIAPTWE